MVKKSLLILFFILINFDLFSQCAMCKSVVEANLESGSSIGAGLNDGILYLMAMPYISILLFGVFWFFQNKKTKPVT
jgi:hypothetical protein